MRTRLATRLVRLGQKRLKLHAMLWRERLVDGKAVAVEVLASAIGVHKGGERGHAHLRLEPQAAGHTEQRHAGGERRVLMVAPREAVQQRHHVPRFERPQPGRHALVRREAQHRREAHDREVLVQPLVRPLVRRETHGGAPSVAKAAAAAATAAAAAAAASSADARFRRRCPSGGRSRRPIATRPRPSGAAGPARADGAELLRPAASAWMLCFVPCPFPPHSRRSRRRHPGRDRPQGPGPSASLWSPHARPGPPLSASRRRWAPGSTL
mmetsp:Transcript_23221/g.72512  ORF Transcript_23221/g.72512 Transcript_23221/m.72512 type:complete len:268 (-) Transcript_23221:58-861(-)